MQFLYFSSKSLLISLSTNQCSLFSQYPTYHTVNFVCLLDSTVMHLLFNRRKTIFFNVTSFSVVMEINKSSYYYISISILLYVLLLQQLLSALLHFLLSTLYQLPSKKVSNDSKAQSFNSLWRQQFHGFNVFFFHVVKSFNLIFSSPAVVLLN